MIQEALEGSAAVLGTHKCNEFFYRDLMARYTESGRHYHSMSHINRMLSYLPELFEKSGIDRDKLQMRAIATMAVLYHDIVYVPGWELNESMSAKYAEDHLEAMMIKRSDIDTIKSVIMATKNHEPRTVVQDVVCSADLYELGTGYYDANAYKVWGEFGYPVEEVWKEGRTKFLVSYLGKYKLFHVPHMEEHEKVARRKMKEELATLGGCPNDTDGDLDCGHRYCPFCGGQ